ncbi:DNA glycosylase AlkZ-like family protein, partial [Streptomyces sp. McG3]|uniref:DNA glycosylase AlkZ-like family protein n=1 Tax=Streptomyces sp. McG3 TaxID=2725483 RepID=UPI001BE93AA3
IRAACCAPTPVRLSTVPSDRSAASSFPRHLAAAGYHPTVVTGDNQSYGSVLIDGFFDAVWRVAHGGDTATLTVQPLRSLVRAERAEITEEAARMLTAMTDATDHDVRFGTFLDHGD